MEESYKPDHMLDKRYPNDYTKEILEDFAKTTNTTHGVTIPVNIEVKAEQKIIDYNSMEQILKKASKYALQDCECRLGLENCDNPNDVCIALDDYADKRIEIGKYNARMVTYEEALDAVKRAHDAGLVHMAYSREEDDFPKGICGCCTCCCAYLGGVVRFGVSLPIVTSDKVAAYDSELCGGCGVCVDRCQFDAREFVDGKLVFHVDRCFGCSNCTSTCSNQANTMIPRNQ